MPKNVVQSAVGGNGQPGNGMPIVGAPPLPVPIGYNQQLSFSEIQVELAV